MVAEGTIMSQMLSWLKIRVYLRYEYQYEFCEKVCDIMNIHDILFWYDCWKSKSKLKLELYSSYGRFNNLVTQEVACTCMKYVEVEVVYIKSVAATSVLNA